MEFLRPPMFYGMGAPQKYLGKCFNDTTVEVAVLFAPDIQQIIDPRIPADIDIGIVSSKGYQKGLWSD